MNKLVVPLLAGVLLAVPLPGQEDQAQSLSDSLPAQTVLYFEIPDVPGLLEGVPRSSLGRIYHEEEVQAFIKPLLDMVQSGWVELRKKANTQGVPPALLHWEALTSMEAGFAFLPTGGPGGEPAICFGLSLGLQGTLAPQVLQLLGGMLAAQGKGSFLDDDSGQVLRIPFEGDEHMDLRVENGNTLVAWMQTGEFGPGHLAGNPRFSRTRSQVFRPGSQAFFYMDLGSGIDLLLQAMDANRGAVQPAELLPTIRKAFDVSGLTSLGAMAISSGWKNGDSFSVGSLGFAEGGPKGFFAHTGSAVDTGLLDYIPGEATSFTLGAADPQAGWKTFENLVDTITAMEVQPGTTLGDLWRQSGHPTYDWLAGGKRVRIEKGFQGFGPRSFSFATTSGNGIGFGGGAGGSFQEVTDVAGVRSLLSELMPVVKEGLDSLPKTPFHLEVKHLSVRETDEQGNTVNHEGPAYYVLRFNASILPPQMQPMMMILGQIQPSFGVTDDGWLVSYISSATVRKYLRDGVKKQDRSIRTNQDVASFLQHAPKAVQLLGWSDPRPGIQAAVSTGATMLPMMAMGMEQNGVKLPFDLDKFPSPDPFVRNLRPTETFAAFRDDSLVWESTGSFGLAEVFTLGGAVASTLPIWVAARGGMNGSPGSAPPPQPAAPIEHEAEEESAPDANLTAARSELKRLETGILVFQLEVGRYPGDLAEIVRPGENYPHGYLPQPARGIVPDPWGHDYVYLPPSGNGSYLLYSMGPNGQDEGGKGDDVTP